VNAFSFEHGVFHGITIALIMIMKLTLFPLLTGLLLLASCHTTETGVDYLSGIGGPVPQSPESFGATEHISYWDEDGSSGPQRIVIDLRRQVAEFHRGGKVIGVAAISSGKEGRNTPAGQYKVMEKDATHKSASYGFIEDMERRCVNDDATPRTPVPPGCRYVPAPMPWFLRLTSDGVGMHEGYLPGYPASHGCIRTDPRFIQQFYNHAYVGMPVTVVR
jgi:lipoprotein-anchoring transpeptidase ErfK/SrfK